MTIRAEVLVERPEFTLDVSLDVPAGQVLAVLGPNGAGKSTLVRALAGLQRLDAGQIQLDGRIVDDGKGAFIPAHRRDVGLVFQDYALFPHLSVRENVAFGPRSRGQRASAARESAGRMLDRMGIAEIADRRPGEISGGQAQRVALARALITDPSVLLLDEPLAALDARTRQAVRVEMSRHLVDFPGVTVLITHDPLDALLLADRILVLEEGRRTQDCTPDELVRRPRSPYVATLLGVNLLRGVVRDDVFVLDDGGMLRVADTGFSGPALAAIRPDVIMLHRDPPESSHRNVWPGVVSAVEMLPGHTRVHVDARPCVIASVQTPTVTELRITRGLPIWLSVAQDDIDAYPA